MLNVVKDLKVSWKQVFAGAGFRGAPGGLFQKGPLGHDT